MSHPGTYYNRMYELRHARRPRITFDELQKKTGLAKGFLSDVERGIKKPNIINCHRIALAFGKSVDYVFPCPEELKKTVGRVN